MDFGFSAEEKAFREDVRRFLKQEVTDDVRAEVESGMGFGPHTWSLLRKLGAKRWLTPQWPEKYGGMGATYVQKFIIQEELAYAGGPETLVAVSMAGPVVLRYGSEEQRNSYLPQIARGEIEFALGYTEPQAGSDLAALEIRAVDQGDHFVMNGQKVFNTSCHYAQYHWLGARTDTTGPKHRGISLFIVDMKTPGIEVRPIWCLSRRTNEVFYDNVRVPKSNMVGEKNKGWIYIGEALAYERTWITGDSRRLLEELVAYAGRTKRNGRTLAEEPMVRQRLAELAVEVETSYLFGLRNAWMLDNGRVPHYEAPMAKVFGSELYGRVAQAAMQLLGPYSQVLEGSKWVELEGLAARRYLDGPRPVITRGSSEIMRNIVALRGLDLPR